jgi:hypothetical protein
MQLGIYTVFPLQFRIDFALTRKAQTYCDGVGVNSFMIKYVHSVFDAFEFCLIPCLVDNEEVFRRLDSKELGCFWGYLANLEYVAQFGNYNPVTSMFYLGSRFLCPLFL